MTVLGPPIRRREPRGWRHVRRSVVAAVAAGALIVFPSPPSRADLGPLRLSTTRGPVGATVTITGSGLAATDEVSFGGVAARFTVVSDTEVAAVVPPRAVTAPVEVDAERERVTTPKAFSVLPNVLVVLTDDQRWDTLRWMPNVKGLLVRHGINFTNAFVENPLCCPSRASFLTGRNSHTTGMYSNEEPYGGFSLFDDSATLATWLDAAGYATFLTGKYLNHYPQETHGLYEPPGWDRWRAFASTGAYFDYDISVDGTATKSFGDAPRDYSTDVITGYADDMIRRTSAQNPLFLWFAPLAPHGPSTPAPRDAGTLARIDPWRPPSYNERDVSDKPAYVQRLPRLFAVEQAELDSVREHQLESLGAVDDAVGTLVDALRDTGRLQDTVIVFASDNGYLWGEHRRDGKTVPYEESIRIPLVIRWDRLSGTPRTDDRLVENVDLAPTLVDVAGADARGFDGLDLMPLLEGRSAPPWRSGMLIEHAGAGAPSYCGDRTKRDVLIHYETGEEEYYRIIPGADPYELRNRITDRRFRRRIALLRNDLRTLCDPPPPGMSAF